MLGNLAHGVRRGRVGKACLLDGSSLARYLTLIVGDKLSFYFSARPKPAPDAPSWDADGHTGLAILRRDGFASMDACEETETLTTRPVTFRGKYLLVNADYAEGELKVEVLDKDGKVIEPFTLPISFSAGFEYNSESACPGVEDRGKAKVTVERLSRGRRS